MEAIEVRQLSLGLMGKVKVEPRMRTGMAAVDAACRRCEYQRRCPDQGIERTLCPKNRALRVE